MTTKDSEKRVILFVVSGMSPAVITETVWALAGEGTPCIPHRVIAVTSTPGAETIRKQLFTAEDGTCAWDALRKALKDAGHDIEGKLQFGETANDIRVFERCDPATQRTVLLDDIRQPADNDHAADFLLRELRPYTEDPHVELIASIAGGRKTMSALLYGCISLIGREHDRVTHILVNSPYDQALSPGFFFPTQPHQTLLTRDGTKVLAKNARLELADLPFVPLRNAFQNLAGLPGSFRQLVSQYRDAMTTTDDPVQVTLTNKGVMVDDVEAELGIRERLLLHYLLEVNSDEDNEIRTPQDAVEDFFDEFLPRQTSNQAANWVANHGGNDDIRRSLNKIRTTLEQAGITWVPSRDRKIGGMKLPAFDWQR